MIVLKIVLSMLAMACGVVSTVIAVKAYMMSLRNELRLKYNRVAGSSAADRLVLMQREYERRLCQTITVILVMFLLMAAVAYLTVQCLKNNVPLI